MVVELNIDAMVGPSHHFGGVGVGNVASHEHTQEPSHPRTGALEGLRKAKLVAELGVPQYVLPPLRRPLPQLLSQLGFTGDLQSQCAQARRSAPAAYSAMFSSAFMWAANAATMAPACDCADKQTHVTLANLCSSWHRWFEHSDRHIQLQRMFATIPDLPVLLHEALPPLVPLRDEGAANHMRLCNAAGDIGFHVFVYGEAEHSQRPKLHLPRQTLAACQAIARLHQLEPSRTFFLQQHPDAIDAGVFHNDVIATSHRNLLLMHERAFLNGEEELKRLTREFARATGETLQRIVVPQAQLSLTDAVKSYLFNSQLLTPAGDRQKMVLLCAAQCQRMPAAGQLIDGWIASSDNPISDVRFVSLDQSMSGGGGPACLRLRLSLAEHMLSQFAPAYRLTDSLFTRLEQVIVQHYPERLEWETLAHPDNLACYERAYAALEEVFGSEGDRRA